MTIDEIERTLQTVAENQAKFSTDVARLEEQTAKLAGAGRIFEEASQLHQQVLRNHEARHVRLDEAFSTVVDLLRIQEERIDLHDETHRDTDARLNVLIDSQLRLGEKVDKLTADIFVTSGQVEALTADIAATSNQIAALTAGISAVNGRVERIDQRLDRMSEREEAHDRQLTLIGEYIETHSRQLTGIDERLDQVVALQAEGAEQIKALVTAQTAAIPKPKDSKRTRVAKKVRKSSRKKGAK
jgi:chromosome segregation ATPase